MKSTSPVETLIALLLLAAMACAALAIHVGARRAESWGPRLIETAADGNVWLTVDQDLLIASAAGGLLRRADMRALNLPGPLNALAPLPAVGGETRMLAGVIDLPEWLVLDGQGRVVGRIAPQGIDPAHRHTFHLAAADGRIAMATSGDHRVLLFDADGRRIAESPPGLFRFANGLWHEDGRWWVVDTNNRRLRALNGSTLAEEFSIPVPETAGARFPALARRGPAGAFTVSVMRADMDRGVVVDLTAQGDLLRQYPARAADPAPVAFAWLGDTLLLADRSDYSLRRFDATGRDLGPWGDGAVADILKTSWRERQRWSRILLAAQLAAGLLVLAALVAYAFWKHRPAPDAQAVAVLATLATPRQEIKDRWLAGARLYWPLPTAMLGFRLLLELSNIVAPRTAPLLAIAPAWAIGCALFYWAVHRIERNSRHPEFEALLSGRAVEWLTKSAMAQNALQAGEAAREVLMVQTSPLLPAFNREFWVLTDRRFLVFQPGPGNDAKLLAAVARRDCSARVEPPTGWRTYLNWSGRIRVTARDGRDFAGQPASPHTARRMADLLGIAKRTNIAGARASTAPLMRSPEPATAFVLSLIVPGLAQLLQDRFLPGALLLTVGALLSILIAGPVLLGWLGHYYDVPQAQGLFQIGIAAFWALLAAGDAALYARKAHR